MMDHCDGAAKNKNLKADETEKPIVVSLEEAVAKMKPSHLADFLNVRSVPNLDLLIFYFHFESAFDQVSWTWVKMFKESPLSTLINVPLSHISKPLYEVSVDWIKQHPIKGFIQLRVSRISYRGRVILFSKIWLQVVTML
ncbi:unnamed protein product [Brassica oleracea var. botrytis]